MLELFLKIAATLVILGLLIFLGCGDWTTINRPEDFLT